MFLCGPTEESHQRKECIVRERLAGKGFDEKLIKIHRTIQIASLLPLTLIVALLFYFRQAYEFGILAFFFILVLGIFVPQLRGDSILTRIVLEQEIAEKLEKFKEEIVTLVDERLEKKNITTLGKQNHVSGTANQRSSPSR